MEKLLINDIPLSELGAVLAPDSYKSVLTWAKFKSIDSNDWAEENYVEYDLSSLKLDKRTVTLNFHALAQDGYKRFIGYLLQYVYSFFEFPELGVTLRLRVDNNSLKHIGKWDSFSITFADDAPYTQTSPALSTMDFEPTGYKLDGTDFAVYGITILKGTQESFIQVPQAKERLTINEKSFDGAIYDGSAYPTTDSNIKLKSGTFTLKMLLRAENLVSAVRNYYYLNNLLRQNGSRQITRNNEIIHCYYNQCTVNGVHSQLASGFSGIAFDLTLNIVE